MVEMAPEATEGEMRSESLDLDRNALTSFDQQIQMSSVPMNPNLKQSLVYTLENSCEGVLTQWGLRT